MITHIPKIITAMGNIDDDLISGAAEYRRTKKRIYTRWGIIAACLCLVIAGSVIWFTSTKPLANDGASAVLEDGANGQQLEITMSSSTQASMIGFIIYQGRTYKHYERMEKADILGDYLGTITGNIDELTSPDEYTELSGSVKGDFFSVKGYDPQFMLCMKETTGSVSTFVCDNGNTMKYGRELFEDRIHLMGNFNDVQYETRASWFSDKNELYRINASEEVLQRFIEQLDEAEIIPWEEVPAKEGLTASSIYDTEIYHIYFKMTDGMTVHLRLYENGYVRFQGLLDICVKISGDSFDNLINIMKNNTDAGAVSINDKLAAKFERCKNDPLLGKYIPAYVVPDVRLTIAEVKYYIAPQTGSETGTKEIYIEYAGEYDSNISYSVTITWRDEYGKNGWAGPMLDKSELSAGSLSEYVTAKTYTGTQIQAGVWYDDVSVVLSTRGISVEEALEIFNSVR